MSSGTATGRKKAVGKQKRPECQLDGPRAVARVSSVQLNSWLLSYRAAVDDLVKESSIRLGPSDRFAAEGFVAERLGQQEFTSVLSRL